MTVLFRSLFLLWAPLAAMAPMAALAAEPSPAARAALQALLEPAAGAGSSGAGPAAATGSPVAAATTGARAGATGASATAGAPGSPASAPTDSGSGARKVVTVVRGQALDHVIRQQLPASPLKPEVLREVFRQINPEAFAPGPGYRLLNNARLQVPTREDQLRVAFGVVPPAPAAEPADGAGAAPYGAAAAARRGWIRYP